MEEGVSLAAGRQVPSLTPEDYWLIVEAVAYWSEALATTEQAKRIEGILNRLDATGEIRGISTAAVVGSTQTGKQVTEAEIAKWAGAAERGYDTRVLLIRKVLRAHDGSEFEAGDFPTFEDAKKASAALAEIKTVLANIRGLKQAAEAVLVLTEQPGNTLPDEVFNLAAAAHRVALVAEEGR